MKRTLSVLERAGTVVYLTNGVPPFIDYKEAILRPRDIAPLVILVGVTFLHPIPPFSVRPRIASDLWGRWKDGGERKGRDHGFTPHV